MTKYCVLLAALVLSTACDKQPEPEAPKSEQVAAAKAKKANATSASQAKSAKPRADAKPTQPFRFPAPKRLVAFGDVHGSLSATRAALKLAGAINDEDDWIGKGLVVVQTGDQLDRGDDERAILDLFTSLEAKAKAAGGAFHVLNGNHETMNAMGDFRYATPGGTAAFDDIKIGGAASGVERHPPKLHGRARAFLPGGVYAKRFAKRNLIAIVGDSVFVHGGLLEKHVDHGIGRINNEVRDYLNAKRRTPPASISGEDAPVWTRLYSDGEPTAAACAQLGRVLGRLKAKRMVVGHTVQKGGITSACNQQIWRVDVGMSLPGGKPYVLEIQGDSVKPLG